MVGEGGESFSTERGTPKMANIFLMIIYSLSASSGEAMERKSSA
jgi:hypothetical protein